MQFVHGTKQHVVLPAATDEGDAQRIRRTFPGLGREDGWCAQNESAARQGLADKGAPGF